jgi:D-alanyl-D-alanine carboxypeptidase
LQSELQKVLDRTLATNPAAIGLLVHVEAPDLQLSWSGAAGHADKDGNSILAADQPALLASNAKTYVAAAIFRLVEQGQLAVDDAVGPRLTEPTNALLVAGGYDTSAITIGHMLNHTSGIFDYNAADGHMEFVVANPKHEWTKEEQLEKAMSAGAPLGAPGEQFSYADTNYVLLAEIIEVATEKPFYTSIRELINFEAQAMHKTWWAILEPQPASTKPLAHQYASDFGLDAYELHQSFDLYGGGGIASTSKDLAIFIQNLFTGRVFREKTTLAAMTTKATPVQPMEGEYMSGLSTIDVNGVQGIGHGGFWGTAANYFPKLNASVAVVVLDRNQRQLRAEINQAMVDVLIQQP